MGHSTIKTLIVLALAWPLPTLSAAERAVEFNREIRPILSDACFPCHGPDKAKRKAGLRLDTEAGAFGALRGGGRAVVPGHPEKSELVRRTGSADADERMPPPASGRHLTPPQVDLLRRWVE